MKSQTKKLLAVLVALVMLFSVVIPAVTAAGAKSGGTKLSVTPIDPASLNVPKLGETEAVDTDIAEALPYGLNDTVRVSIFLDEPSARDAGYAVQGVSSNARALSYQKTLRRGQDAIQAKIESATGRAIDVKWNLTLLTNAISANVRYGDIAKIAAVKGVKSVEIEQQYAPCVVGSSDADQPMMSNARDMVRSNSGNATKYTGAGTRLAIIDTGLDIDHQSMDADAFDYAIAEDEAANGVTYDLLTQTEVNSIKSTLNAKNGIYRSSKLPFIYNYVDNNTTVTHINDQQGEHGSHVCGIAAANRYLKSGASFVDAAEAVSVVGEAPDAQLFVMKVFGAGGGAYDSDYFSAVEDAIRLGASSANLSLGSSNPGSSYATSTYQSIMNSLKDTELALCVSMGNNDSWDSQKQLYADDVNLMTGGSPGSFVNSFTVASIDDSGAALSLIHFGDISSKYDEMADGNKKMLPEIAGTYEFIYLDTVGYTDGGDTYNSRYDQFNTLASLVSGKVALCNRGTSSFFLKANSAMRAGAVALLVVNNQPGSMSSTSVDGYTYNEPVVGIKQSVGEQIKAAYEVHTSNGINYYTGTVKIDGADEKTPLEYYEMSDFSSWGVTGALTLKPEITAPGGGVLSLNGYHQSETTRNTYEGGHDQYELMSGTSMAAPQITGLTAALGQYYNDNGIADKTGLSARHFAISELMATATPIKEEESAHYYSLLKQGAGLANLEGAVDAKSYIKMGADATISADDYKVKAEVGDDPARSGVYTYTFEIHNFSDTDVEYTLKTDVFTQALSADKTLMEHTTVPMSANVSYAWNDAEPIAFTADVDQDGDTDEADADAILAYVSGANDGADYDLAAAEQDGVDGITSRDAYALLAGIGTAEAGVQTQIVAAGGMRTVTVTIKLTDAQKAALDAEREGGAYLEAYTFIESEDDVTYSIPVLGFYGSWTDASMFDAVRYEESYYGTNQSSYFGATNTNGWQIRFNGSSQNAWYTGNPYVKEAAFPADRLALSSEANLYQVRYNLIRPSAGGAFAAVKEDGTVLYAANPSANANAAYYNTQSNTPSWQNTSTSSLNANQSVSSFGLAEGEKFTFGYFAFPEYYIRQATGDLQTNALTSAQFQNILKTGNYGKGAYIGYTVTVDNTEPEIFAPVLNDDGTVTLTFGDNQYVANLRVMDASGTTTYINIVPEQTEAGAELTYTFTPESNYLTIFVADYAGNEAAATVSLDGSPIVVNRTVYRLTNTLEAGKNYLIVNANTAGTRYALSHTNTTKGRATVTVVNDNGVMTIEEVDANAVFTAAANGSGVSLKNGNYYLAASRNNVTFSTTAPAATAYFTFDGTNNRLSYLTGNNTYYVRYSNNAYTGSSTAYSVYLFAEETYTETIDPSAVTSVEVSPATLELYKDTTAILGAKVLPLTATDRTVSWSSSNPSVATVDENGVVTAVAAGSCNIIATANGDSSISASCAVTVVHVSKNLNGIIWDEEGGEYFASFNTATIPAWTKGHDDAKSLNLNAAFQHTAANLYAADLDMNAEDSMIYSVNRSTYALTEYGENYLFAFDMARASSQYTGYFVYPFATYLVFGNMAPEEDPDEGTYCGFPYGLLDLTATDIGEVFIAGLAARQIGTTSSYFYFLDETGRIWQTQMRISNSVTFSTPTLIADTGISTSFLYQNLYYDGTYIYWAHTDGDYAEMIIVNPNNGAVYHAGTFDENVWPVTGLYVNGSVAPAAVEDEAETTEAPAALERLSISRDELMTDAVRARIAAEAQKYADKRSASAAPANRTTGGTNAVRGSTAAPKSLSPAISVNAAAAGITADDGNVTVTLTEAEASNNGKITVTYDASQLAFVSASSTAAHYSVNAQEGTVTFAYASLDAIAAESAIAELTFTVNSCTDTSVTATTTERNAELALSEETTPAITGLGHSFTNYVNQNDATCTENGHEIATCDRCDATDSREIEDSKLGHSFTNYVNQNDATCTENGTETAVCDRCDATDSREIPDSALGHSFTAYVNQNDATCTENGTETAVCDRCDATDSREIPDSALGHSFTNYVSDDNAGCLADGTKTAVCDRCDATDTIDDEGSALGHSFTNYVSDNNATCLADGTKTAKCERCDVTDTIADEGSAKGHSFVTYVSDNNATCLADGTKTAKCERCDVTDTIDDVGSALGHSFTNYVSNGNATCTGNGTKTAKCDRCDVTDTVEIPNSALGHSTVIVGAKEPTDYENGYTGDEVCTVCGQTIKKGKVISLTGDVCPWCGEVHNDGTFVGFWTEFIHDFLFIIHRLMLWWK